MEERPMLFGVVEESSREVTLHLNVLMSNEQPSSGMIFHEKR